MKSPEKVTRRSCLGTAARYGMGIGSLYLTGSYVLNNPKDASEFAGRVAGYGLKEMKKGAVHVGQIILTEMAKPNIAPPVETGVVAVTSPEKPALGELSVLGPPSINAAQIRTILSQYNSPLINEGGAVSSFIDYSNFTGIDAAIPTAFFIHESTAGTMGEAITSKSIGNIRYTDPEPGDKFFHKPGIQEAGYRQYHTWKDGIEDWYKLIKELYIDYWGLDTVDKIIPRYAPAGDNNDEGGYIYVVKKLVYQWRTGDFSKAKLPEWQKNSMGLYTFADKESFPPSPLRKKIMDRQAMYASNNQNQIS